MFQEYACTGVGWGVRPKRIFEYRGGSGVQKWPFWGVHTLWMVPMFSTPGGRIGICSKSCPFRVQIKKFRGFSSKNVKKWIKCL